MKIEKDVKLKDFTTFRIGGPAQFFCAVTTEAELQEAVKFAHENNLEIFVLGGGSNILISDEGFEGLVIKMEMKGATFTDDGDTFVHVEVKAGEEWDGFVAECVGRGLYGVETLSYIPGTVGGAVVQNAGAYGTEVKDIIETVRVFDITQGVFADFMNHHCEFEYRNSLFKRDQGRYIILSVTFRLEKKGTVNTKYREVSEYFSTKNISSPTLEEVRNAVIEIRKRKLPDVHEIGTAGSFFKNPIIALGHAAELKQQFPDLPVYPVDDTYVKVSLAWIIDKACNFKGMGKGDVGTYKNQALVLVNNGNATAKEVKEFAHEIEKIVFEKTKIQIEPEVLYI